MTRLAPVKEERQEAPPKSLDASPSPGQPDIETASLFIPGGRLDCGFPGEQ
jgi:hypothetical protein